MNIPPQYRDADLSDFPEHDQKVKEWLAGFVETVAS